MLYHLTSTINCSFNEKVPSAPAFIYTYSQVKCLRMNNGTNLITRAPNDISGPIRDRNITPLYAFDFFENIFSDLCVYKLP